MSRPTNSLSRWTQGAVALGVLVALTMLVFPHAPFAADDDDGETKSDIAPNVVLVSMDTCRSDRMGFSGHSRNTTPNLDRLAKKGTVFTRAYAQSNETLYSHTAILTGRHPGSLLPLNHDFVVPEAVTTLAEVFKIHGYKTAGFVGGAHMKNVFGFDAGFNEYMDEYDFASMYYTVPLARKWMAENRQSPFFLFVHGYDCHDGYGKPLWFHHLFDTDYEGVADQVIRDGFGITRLFKDRYFFSAQRVFSKDRIGRRFLSEDFFRVILPKALAEGEPSEAITDRDMSHIEAHYDSSLVYGDMFVGLLLAELDRLELAENTLVVVLSDHGEGLGDYEYAHHRPILREHILHVPLVMYAPFLPITHQREISDLVQTIDVAPTILDILDFKLPAEMSATSLLPTLNRLGDTPRDAAFAQSRTEAAIRTEAGLLVLDLWELDEPIPVDALRGAPLQGGPFTYYEIQEGGPNAGMDIEAEPGAPAEKMRARLLDWLSSQRPTINLGEFERLEPTDKLFETLQKKGYW